VSYIGQLKQTIVTTCTRCHSTFCLACGEGVSADVQGDKRVGGKNALFHCSNLQGVILGMGLYMIEQTFKEKNQVSPDTRTKDDTSRTSKKRKTILNAGDDSDDSYYGSVPGSKRSKGGIGYAGDAREDVSV
jgi:hypothetical protein